MFIEIRNDEWNSCINKFLVHHKLNVAHFEAHAYLFLQAKLEGSTTPSQTRLATPLRNDSVWRDDWFLKSGSPIDGYGAYASTLHLAVF